MIKKYIQITKPIEAIQWTGKNKDELKKFSDSTTIQITQKNKIITISPIGIQTLWNNSKTGDYLLKNKHGEITIIDKKEFEDEYVEVTDDRYVISINTLF